MASIRFQCLLRLPPCLRRDTLMHISNISRNAVCRTPPAPQRPFSQTIFNGAKGNNKPTRPISQPGPAKNSQKPPPPHTIRSKPPPRPSAPGTSSPSSNSYITRLLGNSSEVLLYRAPPHTGFTITSLLAGAIIIVGSMNFFFFALRGRPGDAAPVPWHIKTLTLVPSLAMAVMGTTFLIAPSRLVRAITLVSRQAPPPPVVGTTTTTTAAAATVSKELIMLRFNMRPTIPLLPGLLRGKTIEVPPQAVRIDLRVKTLSLSSMRSIPISEADSFTSTTGTATAAGRFSRFNSSLVNIWPATIHNIRRMFLRDSMAYMSIEGHGLWKVDLHRCTVVDDAVPLRHLTRQDGNVDRSVFGRVRALLASV